MGSLVSFEQNTGVSNVLVHTCTASCTEGQKMPADGKPKRPAPKVHKPPPLEWVLEHLQTFQTSPDQEIVLDGEFRTVDGIVIHGAAEKLGLHW